LALAVVVAESFDIALDEIVVLVGGIGSGTGRVTE
jgi:hypothetical protein